MSTSPFSDSRTPRVGSVQPAPFIQLRPNIIFDGQNCAASLPAEDTVTKRCREVREFMGIDPLHQRETPNNISKTSTNQPTPTRHQKFEVFETKVIIPLANQLVNHVDPDASVRVCGSYQSDPNTVRLFSDIDVIFLSQQLKDPIKYVEFLFQLRSAGSTLMNSSLNANTRKPDLKPIFFTRQAVETHMQCAAALLEHDTTSIVKNYERLVPCHFLYYGDVTEMLRREGDLGPRLLRNSREVGAPRLRDDSMTLDPSTTSLRSDRISSLAQLEWDLERYLAELILNVGNGLPTTYLITCYTQGVFSSVRAAADHSVFPEARNVPGLLKQLDPDHSDSLYRSFGPILEQRQNGAQRSELEPYISPVVQLLWAVRGRIKESQQA